MRTMSVETLQPDWPDVEDRLEFREFALRFLGYVAVWLVLVILFAMVGYATDWLDGRAWKFHTYLTWSFIQWSTLALLLPVALWLAPHDAIEPPHRWRVLGANFGVSLIFALTAVILGAVLTDFILPNADLHNQFTQFLSKHAAADFLAYWVLVGVRQASHFYRERLRRELHASRLTAQLAQSRVQSHIEVRRRLGRLPFVEQRHRLAKLIERSCAGCTSTQMVVELRRHGRKPGGQIRKQFANFWALHDLFLHTNSFSSARKVS